MAIKRAKGKKSYAISDISGFKVPYKSLKTNWKGQRVEPEDYDPKHPQLTPPKNVIDAVALFQPRPDNDPENVEFHVGYNYGDIFLDPKDRPRTIGMRGVGVVEFTEVEFFTSGEVTGVNGTGALGTISLFITLDVSVSGVNGTGAIGTETFITSKNISGVNGTGALGTQVTESEITEAGVNGTGAIGTESLTLSALPSGVNGTGAIEGFGLAGDGNLLVIVTGVTGIGATGATGTETAEAEITETGLNGTGALGTVSIQVNRGWGEDAWSTGTWGN
jgi:hypothetical protein